MQLASCQCNDAWTGDDCTEDFDACSDANPSKKCDPVQTCYDLPAPQVGFNCSECPDEYENINDTCVLPGKKLLVILLIRLLGSRVYWDYSCVRAMSISAPRPTPHLKVNNTR